MEKLTENCENLSLNSLNFLHEHVQLPLLELLIIHHQFYKYQYDNWKAGQSAVLSLVRLHRCAGYPNVSSKLGKPYLSTQNCSQNITVTV
jgi:hypothetical protein